MKPFRYRTIVLAFATLMLLAACGGSGGGGGDASSSGNTKTFTAAFTSIGLSSSPFLAALDDLRGQGYKVETPEIAESELVTEGVANGQFAFGSGANNAVMTAVNKGANLKLIVDRVNNEWTLYARKNITSCADLNGKRLAIHSEGAVSTVMVRNYIEKNCPGTQPNYIVISGSPNRVAALISDEIDASPLEVGDAATIEKQAGDRFALLASFSEELPQLRTTSVYVNGDFAAKNPDTVTAVVKAILQQHRKIEEDPAYLKQIGQKYAGKVLEADTVDDVVQTYVDRKMFPVDGGLTEEGLKYTAEFFGPDQSKAVDVVLPVDKFADLTFLNRALGELGNG
jgi:NitT/TauT family transport system substrate-binding protein